MHECLPMIKEAEYAGFLGIKGMAEPPAVLGLPATYGDWLARHKAALRRFEARKQKVVVVEVTLDEFRKHIGAGITKASVRDLWQVAKKKAVPEEAPKKDDPFSRWGRGEAD